MKTGPSLSSNRQPMASGLRGGIRTVSVSSPHCEVTANLASDGARLADMCYNDGVPVGAGQSCGSGRSSLGLDCNQQRRL
jgi:hypothetical protein